MAGGDWAAVDSYIADRLIGEDAALAQALADNEAAGLPAIDVSPAQGKFLNLLARMAGARHILEIGTLGGYSTIWLARALPSGGKVVMLEVDPHHADVARANIARAGVAERVDIRVGPARDTLAQMQAEGVPPFDFVFIDADKQSNPDYLRAAMALSRPGTVIICDNVIREGRVVDASSTDSAITATRRLFDDLGADPRLSATAIQTVGVKGWDGFAMAIVGERD